MPWNYIPCLSCILYLRPSLLNSNSSLRRMTLRGNGKQSCSTPEMQITNVKPAATCSLLLLYLYYNFKFRKVGLHGQRVYMSCSTPPFNFPEEKQKQVYQVFLPFSLRGSVLKFSLPLSSFPHSNCPLTKSL